MATEPAARSTPTPPPRDAGRDVPARAAARCPAAPTRTSAPGATTRSTSIAARAAWSGTSTATSSSTCGWATARSSSATRDERVDDYVNERMRQGVSFSLTTEDEVRAMELVKELTGWVDKVRMTVSGHRGDDARDARGAGLHRPRQDREVRGPVPRRPRLRADQRLARRHGRPRRSRTRRSRLAWGRGIPDAVADTIIPAPLQRHRARCAACSRRVARRSPAIIVEPVLGNAQGILPRPGFHQAMRALTEEFGILLIFDEVKTGFRFARGGAAEFFGVTPDLATYAKAMGNGYPAAAFGGREEVMSVLPDKVSHGGTYAGNRVAAAAAVKTLDDPPGHERARDHPRDRSAPPGRPARGPRPEGPAVRLHRPSVHVRDHVHRRGPERVPRLGEHRPRAVRRDRGRDACPRRDARARLARTVVHVRGARRRRHHRPRDLDLLRFARRGPRGSRQGPVDRDATRRLRRRGRLPTERPGRHGPRRQRGPLGRSGGGAAPRPRREPGRGRGHRARPSARASTSRPRRVSSRRSRGADSSSRTRRPASTASGSSSSGSPSGPSGRSTCAASPCPSSNGSPA